MRVNNDDGSIHNSYCVFVIVDCCTEVESVFFLHAVLDGVAVTFFSLTEKELSFVWVCFNRDNVPFVVVPTNVLFVIGRVLGPAVAVIADLEGSVTGVGLEAVVGILDPPSDGCSN